MEVEGLKKLGCLNDVLENIRVIDGLKVCPGIPEDSRYDIIYLIVLLIFEKN